jgi:hypothetical protein
MSREKSKESKERSKEDFTVSDEDDIKKVNSNNNNNSMNVRADRTSKHNTLINHVSTRNNLGF